MSESNSKSFPEFVKKLPKADYASDGAGAIRGFVVEGTIKSYSMKMTKLSSSLRTHTPLHLGLCSKVSVSLSSKASPKFMAPVMFITFRKAPCILPGSLQIIETLLFLMSRAECRLQSKFLTISTF